MTDDWAMQAARRLSTEPPAPVAALMSTPDWEMWAAAIIREEHARSAAPQAQGEAAEMAKRLRAGGPRCDWCPVVDAGYEIADAIDAQAAEIEQCKRQHSHDVQAIHEMGQDVERMREAKAIVDEQAGDGGLWFVAQTCAEAYVQQALRRLHAAIDGKTPDECAIVALSGSESNGQ